MTFFAVGGVRIPFQELLQQQANQIMQYPLYDRCKEAAGTIQVRKTFPCVLSQL